MITLEELEVLRDFIVEEVGNAKQELDLNNKTLDSCLKDQVELEYKWEEIYTQVLSLYRTIEQETESAYSLAYNKAISDAYKNVSATEAKHIATADTKYQIALTKMNVVSGMKDKVDSMSRLLTRRGFSLKGITESVIAGVHKHII
jgi:hypothetical protein